MPPVAAPPFTALLASNSTNTPGTMLAPITVRSPALPDASSHQATIGPNTAPAWSMPRCSPKARPTRSAGVASAINASRGGVRSPLPSRSTTRSPITCHAAPVTAMTGRTTTAIK